MKNQISDLRRFIEYWNYSYPIDKWWRTKHKVALNSEAHRNQDVLSMRLEFEEDLLYQEIGNGPIIEESSYEPGEGKWLNLDNNTSSSKEAIDEAFDNIDIKNINV